MGPQELERPWQQRRSPNTSIDRSIQHVEFLKVTTSNANVLDLGYRGTRSVAYSHFSKCKRMEVAFASASLFSSSSTVDFIPLNAAVNNAVSPSLSVVDRSVPLSKSSRTIESCPSTAAMWRAVQPFALATLTFAPHSSNKWDSRLMPHSVPHSGAPSIPSRTLVPRSSSNFTINSLPPSAAANNAVAKDLQCPKHQPKRHTASAWPTCAVPYLASSRPSSKRHSSNLVHPQWMTTDLHQISSTDQSHFMRSRVVH
jgi:hypothetical protein